MAVPRAPELAEVEAAVGAGLAGRGGLVLVIGEAGIGKTWLAIEMGIRAGAAGTRVAWSACWDGDGVPPHWPWVQLLRELGCTALAASLLAGTDGGTGAGTEPAAERFRIVDETATALGSVAPVLLVVEDLHWVDPASLHLMTRLVPRLTGHPVVVLATVREEPDQSPALAGLRASARIRLGGLPLAELAAILPDGVGEDDLLAVHRRTGGHPLFAGELCRLARARAVRVADVEVPNSVRAVLERRLAAVGEQAGAVLAAAAVLGERFRLDHLAAVLAPGSLPRGLAVATEAGLVRRVDPVRYAFAHALVREVAYDALAATDQATRHGRVGDALARSAERGVPVDASELAAHYRLAASAGWSREAVRHGLRAAEAARRACGYEDAVHWYRVVLELLGSWPAAAGSDAEPGAVLVELAEAELAAGDTAGARAHALAASEHARRDARPDLLAAAALAATGGRDGFEVPGADVASLALLEEARAAQPPTSPAWVRLTARLAVALTRDAPRARRLALAESAVGAARERHGPALLAVALAARCDTTAGPEDVEPRLADAAEIVTCSAAAGDVRCELLGRRLRLEALLECGDVTAADAEVRAFDGRLAVVGQPLYAWYVPLWRAARARAAGGDREADALLDEAAAAGERADSFNAHMLVGVARWLALVAAGEGESQLRVMTDGGFVGQYRGTDMEVSMALCRAAAGHLAAARDALDRLREPLRSAPVDSEWLPMLVQATETVRLLGGHPLAAWLYAALLPHRTRHAVDGIGAYLHGSVERHLGTLAAVLGHEQRAREHFAAARTVNAQIGAGRLVELTERDERAALGAARPDTASLRREGPGWSVVYAGRTATVRDSKGMGDLAVLLARPGTPVPAVELAGVVGGADLGDVIDGRARAAYQARLAELDEELAAADGAGDAARSTRAAAERSALLAQLAQAYGLGGRARRTGDPAERARTAVTWRIRSALRGIEAAHPELGRHLRHSVRTGTACSYDPEAPLRWEVRTS